MGVEKTEKYKKILFVLGILVCLAGAGLMFDGAILGETTTGISTLLGITGIGLIATSTQRRAIINGGE